MADLKVRQLDDDVADALRARANRKGVSLEEEVRSTLTASVEAKRTAFLRRARAIRKAAGGTAGAPRLESTRLIRQERDRRG
ncbi:MAG: FitA-like ribbon-helix-helix domain-containing protein [Acidobacteriota bacterium]